MNAETVPHTICSKPLERWHHPEKRDGKMVTVSHLVCPSCGYNSDEKVEKLERYSL